MTPTDNPAFTLNKHDRIAVSFVFNDDIIKPIQAPSFKLQRSDYKFDIVVNAYPKLWLELDRLEYSMID